MLLMKGKYDYRLGPWRDLSLRPLSRGMPICSLLAAGRGSLSKELDATDSLLQNDVASLVGYGKSCIKP